MKPRIGSIILALMASGHAQPQVAVPDGYAEGTTGGAGGPVRTARSAAEFKAACESEGPAIIVVEGDLGNVAQVGPKSNKTIIGKDTTAGYTGNMALSGVSNIIVQNLNIRNPSGIGTSDGIEASSLSTKIFVTKCTFIDCKDGSFDIKRGSDFVTVSWCRFRYPTISGHNFPNLIGHSNGNGAQDEGKLHVTMHHNWYDAGSASRMPRVRFGTVHVYNNYYNSTGNNYCIGMGVHCSVRFENCFFDKVNRAWQDMGGMSSGGQLGWNNLKFQDASAATFAPNKWPIFTPPYQFTLDENEDIKALVTHPTYGAGNRLSKSSTSVTLSKAQRNSAYINWAAGAPHGSKIRIFDFTGKLVVSTHPSGAVRIIESRRLPSGAYLVR